MKKSDLWSQYCGVGTAEEVFQFLLKSLNESICVWDWFVNWRKVYKNVAQLEIDLNTFNYVAGSENPAASLKELLAKQPQLIRVIPILLACRLQSFLIMSKYHEGDLTPESFAFTFTETPTPGQVESALHFAERTGVTELLKRIKSVPDYVMGVEVGLDSNGRKNRTGTGMEAIVGGLLKGICEPAGYGLEPQATPRKIREKFGIDVKLNKADRDFDFAVHANGKLYIIETNYYSGGGTKLKSTAGEFTQLHDELTPQGHAFIWITDGQGWLTTKGGLQDAFNRTDYLLNLKMVGLGILEAILAGKG